MHMADALLSPAMGMAMNAASVGAIAYSITRIKKDDLAEKKVPMMAVAGAFVFAAQMVNFTIPATGSSGHIGGGILLAALLGGFPSLLTISTVLIIQALFFADGGILALGSNILNLGIIPCLLIYPLVFKPIIKRALHYKSITIASIISVIISLQLGALGVVFETFASGITELPVGSFLLFMQPIHLAIGLVEGIVTGTILCFVYRMRPEMIENMISGTRLTTGAATKKVLVTLAILTVIAGGILSLAASPQPDGLEWSMEKVAGTTELAAESQLHSDAATLQDSTAIMPDYQYKTGKKDGSNKGTSAAGVIGGGLTFLVAGLTGLVLSKARNRRQKASA